MKKLLAVFMTMAIAGVLSLGAVGCKKDEATKKTETKVEKDKGTTTSTTTEKTTDKATTKP